MSVSSPHHKSVHDPATSNGISSSNAASRFRLNDLIARPSLQIDREALQHYLADRTVLVTGAGGSIGTALSHELHALHPARIVLIDVSEHNLFELEQQLHGEAHFDRITLQLADVRNKTAMAALLKKHRPDVVLHAAAYKHVPLMERHPVAAFQNNTLATAQLLQLCESHEVDQFILVSTDKAVQPVNILGATKRLAEWYVHSSSSEIQCKTVRFGNVFGSRGSVVPLFEEQLAAGGPLEVTHPDMERYFMSANDACCFILQTLLLDEAPIYVLKMGEPIRIEWLARKIIRRRYPNANPDDLIVYTGRRPGEKLSEQLCAPTETTRPTQHPAITGLIGPVPHTRHALDAHFRTLSNALQVSSGEETPFGFRHALFDIEHANRLGKTEFDLQ